MSYLGKQEIVVFSLESRAYTFEEIVWNVMFRDKRAHVLEGNSREG